MLQGARTEPGGPRLSSDRSGRARGAVAGAGGSQPDASCSPPGRGGIDLGGRIATLLEEERLRQDLWRSPQRRTAPAAADVAAVTGSMLASPESSQRVGSLALCSSLGQRVGKPRPMTSANSLPRQLPPPPTPSSANSLFRQLPSPPTPPPDRAVATMLLVLAPDNNGFGVYTPFKLVLP